VGGGGGNPPKERIVCALAGGGGKTLTREKKKLSSFQNWGEGEGPFLFFHNELVVKESGEGEKQFREKGGERGS